MKVRISRRSLAVIAVVIGTAVAFAITTAVQHGGTRSASQRFAKADPDAINQPGTLGPATYQAQQLAALAYPSHTVSASLLANERNFYTSNIQGRAPHGPNGWQLVGPTTSTQPAVLNYFNQYYGNNFTSGDLGVSAASRPWHRGRAT